MTALTDAEVISMLEAWKIDLRTEVRAMLDKRLAEFNTVKPAETINLTAQLEDVDKRLRTLEKRTSRARRCSWADKLRRR